jgi:hypothetical protein
MWHDPGLAASPQVRYRLKVEESARSHLNPIAGLGVALLAAAT